jgi:hypothetical protein
MDRNKKPTVRPSNSLVGAECADLRSLHSKAALLGRIGAAAVVSVAARQELKHVRTDRVRMQGSIARTAMSAAGVQIKSALVANEAPKIGARPILRRPNSNGRRHRPA